MINNWSTFFQIYFLSHDARKYLERADEKLKRTLRCKEVRNFHNPYKK